MENPKLCKCGCGGEAKVIKHEYHMCSPTYGVTCYKCGTATNQGFDTEAEAVETWNRAMGATDNNVVDKERTAKVSNQIFNNSNPYTVGAWIGTCECGVLVSYSSKYCHMCGARLEW